MKRHRTTGRSEWNRYRKWMTIEYLKVAMNYRLRGQRNLGCPSISEA
jgi:hypothetical protein